MGHGHFARHCWPQIAPAASRLPSAIHREQRVLLARGDGAGAKRPCALRREFAGAEERADGVRRDDGVRGGERDAGDALGRRGDRRNEADQRAASVERGSAASRLIEGSDDDWPRRVARERSGAHSHAGSGETEDDQIRRHEAEARSFALEIEFAGDHREACRGVRALEPDGLAADGRVRAVGGVQRRQRLARRDDKRGCGRLGLAAGGIELDPGASGAAAALAPGALTDPPGAGNASNELAIAIAMRLELGGLSGGIGEGEAADRRVRRLVLLKTRIKILRPLLPRHDEEFVGLHRLVRDLSGRRRGRQARVEGVQVGVGARCEFELGPGRRGEQFRRRADLRTRLGVHEDAEADRVARVRRGGEQRLGSSADSAPSAGAFVLAWKARIASRVRLPKSPSATPL